MNVRCHRCGITLHEGLPRLHELSPEHLEVVTAGTGVQTDDLVVRPPVDVLTGTSFEGRLTPYNFCTFCLTAITRCPEIYPPEGRPAHSKFESLASLGLPAARTRCKTCGEILSHPQRTTAQQIDPWVILNRRQQLHTAEHLPDRDGSALSELQALLFVTC